MMSKDMDIYLRKVKGSDKDSLLHAYERSVEFLSPWASAPKEIEKYLEQEYLYLACLNSNDEIVGVFNISEVVRGLFQSGYLGYCVFVPFQNKGYMQDGMKLLIKEAFEVLNLHRLEANIQSDNLPSINLVAKSNFSKEGYSPKYLNLDGGWKDHERWAIINEHWVDRKIDEGLND